MAIAYFSLTDAMIISTLLCHKYIVISMYNVTTVVCSRINQAEEEGISVIDVDGSYMYRKYQHLVESGESVIQPDHPGPPPSGWKVVNEGTYKDVTPSIPLVTTGKIIIIVNIISNYTFTGLVYSYLAGHCGRDSSEGAFRALSRGYIHFASGRLEGIEVNINHPLYCHVRCTIKPSMKSGTYHVYLLLQRDGELATMCSATCECAAG